MYIFEINLFHTFIRFDAVKYKRWLIQQKKMNNRLRKTCSKYGKEIKTNISNVKGGEYYAETLNLFYCWNAKVKSTNVETFKVIQSYFHHIISLNFVTT